MWEKQFIKTLDEIDQVLTEYVVKVIIVMGIVGIGLIALGTTIASMCLL